MVWIIVILRHATTSEALSGNGACVQRRDPCGGVEVNAERKKENKVLLRLSPSDPIRCTELRAGFQKLWGHTRLSVLGSLLLVLPKIQGSVKTY